MSNFYLTLPSNSSINFYPNNTLTHYVTKLPSRIHLEGEWEVGLTDIHYPHSWYNLQDAEMFVFKENSGQKIKIEDGYYETTEYIVDTVNQLIETTVKDKRVQLHYNPVNQRTTVELAPHCQYEMNTSLRSLLGFASHQAITFGGNEGQTHKGDHVVDMDRGMYALFVYSDLVTPRIVGDKSVPLLRTVPITGHHGDTVVHYFQNVHYIDVLRKDFDTVEIDIRDDTGQPIPFQRGKLVLTLHFRKKQILL